MRQSILILLDWLLCSIPSSAGISEAVVSGVVLVLLWRGKRVEISLHVALGLGVEFCLERGQLLGHAEETSNFYTKNHPDYICGNKKQYRGGLTIWPSQPTICLTFVKLMFLVWLVRQNQPPQRLAQKRLDEFVTKRSNRIINRTVEINVRCSHINCPIRNNLNLWWLDTSIE